ncbi:MAG TPA: helix-turn-helix domain-containing protein, partial [bacterium]|nr:helix-turn-helix domain-containing protein [bacterium]
MNRRKDRMKVRKLLKLRLEEGRSDRSVARILDVSKTTVGNYYQAFLRSELPLAEVLELSDEDLEE